METKTVKIPVVAADAIAASLNALTAERDRLRSENEELRGALETALRYFSNIASWSPSANEWREQARAALEKAKA